MIVINDMKKKMIGMGCAELTPSYSSLNPPFMEHLMSQKGETKNTQPTHHFQCTTKRWINGKKGWDNIYWGNVMSCFNVLLLPNKEKERSIVFALRQKQLDSLMIGVYCLNANLRMDLLTIMHLFLVPSNACNDNG